MVVEVAVVVKVGIVVKVVTVVEVVVVVEVALRVVVFLNGEVRATDGVREKGVEEMSTKDKQSVSSFLLVSLCQFT